MTGDEEFDSFKIVFKDGGGRWRGKRKGGRWIGYREGLYGEKVMDGTGNSGLLMECQSDQLIMRQIKNHAQCQEILSTKIMKKLIIIYLRIHKNQKICGPEWGLVYI